MKNINGLGIVFGNHTSKDKYTIYYMLKGQSKMQWIYPKNKEKAKKIYEKIISKQPRFVDVCCTKANSIGRQSIATYCPKEFVDSKDIIRKKENKKWKELK